MAHKQYEYTKVLYKLRLKALGVTGPELEYHLAVLDAEEKMRSRFFLTKLILNQFKWIPAVRNILAGWSKKEEAYIQSVQDSFREPFPWD